MTDYQDPTTIDVDEVIANIKNSQKFRVQHWDDKPCWPNVTVAALADEVTRLRRELEFVEIICDGSKLEVNGVPWRDMYERINAIVSDPVPSRQNA